MAISGTIVGEALKYKENLGLKQSNQSTLPNRKLGEL